MNLAVNERTKHRITGLVVIMAFAIIFVPAMLKKSNQRLEENIHVSVQLPPKPTTPKVALATEKTVFETVKVARVTLPTPIKPTLASQIARIENLKPKVPSNPPVVKISQNKTILKGYAVQLAVFSVQHNAEKLVKSLNTQGYKARYHTLMSSEGTPSYRVTVGQLNDRADASQLKNKLFESTQLQGVIIKHNVG
ncbi:MAG: SPOR domain-containing protein [Gammaproteobacteria bacterium]|nr:SPOR domain-containing protein [Gammaproteobacteria bacterium]MCH9764171.1 SPOR domain-containing protein [Gammaproteobacteria bacterium]